MSKEKEIELVAELRKKAADVQLTALTEFWLAEPAKLAMAYNGCGAEWLPERVRKRFDRIFKSFLPAVLIHDYSYSTNFKSLAKFLKFNRELEDNINLLAYDKYKRWYQFIQRWFCAREARALRVICDQLGRTAYEEGSFRK